MQPQGASFDGTSREMPSRASVPENEPQPELVQAKSHRVAELICPGEEPGARLCLSHSEFPVVVILNSANRIGEWEVCGFRTIQWGVGLKSCRSRCCGLETEKAKE